MNIFEVKDKYPSFAEETEYALRRIERSKYLPIEMIINICQSKAMKKYHMVNMNWLLELKESLKEIIDLRKWYEERSLPF